MNKNESDKYYIQETFKLALKGKYTAHPNPMVGAIIVKNGKSQLLRIENSKLNFLGLVDY